jgi:hypothetical protein
VTNTSKRCPFVLAGSLAAVVLARPATAADLSKSATADQPTVITLTGDIVKGDAAKFGRLLTPDPKQHPVAVVKLNSRGGLISEAVKIATLVRNVNIATTVANGAKCTSACFIIFAAGKQKSADPAAYIGVHRALDLTTGKEND